MLAVAEEPGCVAVWLLTLPVALPAVALPGIVVVLDAPGVVLVLLLALLEG